MLFENLPNDTAKELVRKTTFEYIFFLTAKWYSEEHNKLTIHQFNVKNDMYTSKLLLYPFFIAAANGHVRGLFEILGDFYARDNGPTPEELVKLVFKTKDDGGLNFFQPDYEVDTQHGLKIRAVNTYTDWDALENAILDFKITENNVFRDLIVKSDLTTDLTTVSVHTVLGMCIEIIKNIESKFIRFMRSELTQKACFYRSYHFYYNTDWRSKAMEIQHIMNDRKPYNDRDFLNKKEEQRKSA